MDSCDATAEETAPEDGIEPDATAPDGVAPEDIAAVMAPVDAAADEGAAPAGADAALDEVEEVEAVLLEPQAVSTSAAVATPAISVKLRARSTCSPFPLLPVPG